MRATYLPSTGISHAGASGAAVYSRYNISGTSLLVSFRPTPSTPILGCRDVSPSPSTEDCRVQRWPQSYPTWSARKLSLHRFKQQVPTLVILMFPLPSILLNRPLLHLSPLHLLGTTCAMLPQTKNCRVSFRSDPTFTRGYSKRSKRNSTARVFALKHWPPQRPRSARICLLGPLRSNSKHPWTHGGPRSPSLPVGKGRALLHAALQAALRTSH